MALCWLLLLISCANTAVANHGKIFYATPPAVGSWLKSQRELVACETRSSARYMADLGFFHPQCTQLEAIGPQEYKVLKRSKVQLVEGPMWLLEVQRDDTIYWVPIPWHDWL